MYKHIMLSLFISFCGFTGIAFAAPTPPKYVYRVDSRPPSEIFGTGFFAWGTNYNIVAHINGHSCSGKDTSNSGFISTMANRETAQELVRQHTLQGRTAYLYVIRADENFYYGSGAIDYLEQFTQPSRLSINSKHMAELAQEWDAIDHIPPENIMEVEEFRTDGTSEGTSNPAYQHKDTRGNPNTYTDYAADTLKHHGFPRRPNKDDDEGSSGFGGLFSSCFSSCVGVRTSSHYSIQTDYSDITACPNTNPLRIISFNGELVVIDALVTLM